MERELIKTVGALTEGAIKNTQCTISLTGVPATVAVIGLGVVVGLTVVAVTCITTSCNKRESSYTSYDV